MYPYSVENPQNREYSDSYLTHLIYPQLAIGVRSLGPAAVGHGSSSSEPMSLLALWMQGLLEYIKAVITNRKGGRKGNNPKILYSFLHLLSRFYIHFIANILLNTQANLTIRFSWCSIFDKFFYYILCKINIDASNERWKWIFEFRIYWILGKRSYNFNVYLAIPFICGLVGNSKSVSNSDLLDT